MGLKFDRNVDVGMVAAVGTVALGIGLPAFAGWLGQHDDLQKHDSRISALENAMADRSKVDEAFRNEIRSRLDGIKDQVNQLALGLVNKQDRK